MRARNSGHGRHRAVRQHARPVHQKRTGFRRRVQPDQPSDLPGHKTHEGAHHQGEGVGTGAHSAGRQQNRSGTPARSSYDRGQHSGSDLGLSVRRGQRQEPYQRE